jgi:hypothetical protein
MHSHAFHALQCTDQTNPIRTETTKKRERKKERGRERERGERRR